MTCPARNPQAPDYTCWQRIPGITDPMEIRRCQQCPHGRALIASVTWQRGADQDVPDQEDAPEKEDNTMDKPTYTVAQLSELIGISVKNIYNAKGLKRPPSSGSMMGAVLTEMSKRGITWDQVVSAPKGGVRKAAGEPVPDDEAPVVEASATAAEDSQGVAELEGHGGKPATSSRVIILDDLSFDSLVTALRTKMPANTSITINN